MWKKCQKIKYLHNWENCLKKYRVFIKYSVFPKKIVIFPNYASSAAALVPYLRVHTHWYRGETEKGKSPKYFKIFQKKHNI